MNEITETRLALRTATDELVKKNRETITDEEYFVLVGFLDYTFELEKELLRQGEQIKKLTMDQARGDI